MGGIQKCSDRQSYGDPSGPIINLLGQRRDFFKRQGHMLLGGGWSMGVWQSREEGCRDWYSFGALPLRGERREYACGEETAGDFTWRSLLLTDTRTGRGSSVESWMVAR